MVKVVVYGDTTEGYSLASGLVANGSEVHLVDESTSSAVRLKPEIAKMYPNVATLKDDEILLDVKPIKMAVAEAEYLFFTPRIRKTGAEAKTEISLKFKDAITHLSKDCTIVYGAPVGLGGNSEYMDLLKHVVGIDTVKMASYYYYPLEGDKQPDSIGSINGQENKDLAALLGGDKTFVDLGTSERMHAVYVLTRFSRVISTIEIYKNSGRTPMSPKDEIFLDSMIDGLFDLQLIKDSYQGTKSAHYLVNGSIRGIDGYVRRLADSVKTTIRENGLKISRTEIALAWSLDRYGMRSDKLNIFTNLKDRLQSHTGTVGDYTRMRDFYSNKTMLVVACSRADYNTIMADPDRTKMMVIKAVPAIPD